MSPAVFISGLCKFTLHFHFRCAAYATLNRNYFKLDFHCTSGVLCVQGLIEHSFSWQLYTFAMALVGYAQAHSQKTLLSLLNYHN